MDTKWLEDFLALAEAKSFSRAAHLRHITQPAFSRRMQALEAWLGFDLIDRTTYPPRLTAAGENFYPLAQELIGRVGQLRGSQVQRVADHDQAVRVALPHTLSLNFLPRWLVDVSGAIGPLMTQLRVGNVLDVVLWLVEGDSDLLICYHHAQQPLLLDPERYDVVKLGVERMAPYSRVGDDGKPMHSLPGKSHQPAPYLAYSSSAYLGRMTDIALAQASTRSHLRRVCETDMAEGLRQLVLAGHGVAFLPDACAHEDHLAGRLARLPGGWEVEMDIRAYRERPTLSRPARPRAEQVWQYLESQRRFPAASSPTAVPPSGARAS